MKNEEFIAGKNLDTKLEHGIVKHRRIRAARLPTGDALETAGANYHDRWYNGFPYEQRMSLSKPQRHERYSRGNNPTVCCMTGFSRPDDPKGTGYIYAHLEDYRIPLDWYPMSKRTHYLLHRRFIDPEKWCRLVGSHYQHGAWFTLLTMDVRDMYQPFDETYPNGLPVPDECWPDYADKSGITKTSFV